jgi:hypothetical protein
LFGRVPEQYPNSDKPKPKKLSHGGTKTQRKNLKRLRDSVSPWLAKILVQKASI